MSSCCCAVKISIAPINLIISSSTVVLPEKSVSQSLNSVPFILSYMSLTWYSLPWTTFRTSLDVRFPITIRSKGNWSVLYVRMVCVTTLPKCLVHMVSSLKKNNQIQRWLIFKKFYLKYLLKMDFRLKWKKFCINYTILCTDYTLHMQKDAFTLVAAKSHIGSSWIWGLWKQSCFSFPISDAQLSWNQRWISIPHQTPRFDRAGEDILFHYKDRTF